MIDPKDTRMNGLDEAGLREAEATFGATGNLASAILAYLRASTIGGEPVAWAWRYEDEADWRDAQVVPPDPAQEARRTTKRTFIPLYVHPAPSTGEGDQYEPAAVRLLRGPLSKRATSAEFNEWQAREVIEYIDGLRALHPSIGDSEAGAETSLREAADDLLKAFDRSDIPTHYHSYPAFCDAVATFRRALSTQRETAK